MLNFQLAQRSYGTCTYQNLVHNSYWNTNSKNWVTQAIDSLDDVEFIVNATVKFFQCIQRHVAIPPCINDYVILHCYDTNTLSETERIKPTNYQPYGGTSENSCIRQDKVNTDVEGHVPVSNSAFSQHFDAAIANSGRQSNQIINSSPQKHSLGKQQFISTNYNH